MTSRGKDLNASSLNRIAFEKAAVERIQASIASGKGNKRSQGALDKKLELIAKTEAKLAARMAKAEQKASEQPTSSNDTGTDETVDVTEASDVSVDPLDENVAV